MRIVSLALARAGRNAVPANAAELIIKCRRSIVLLFGFGTLINISGRWTGGGGYPRDVWPAASIPEIVKETVSSQPASPVELCPRERFLMKPAVALMVPSTVAISSRTAAQTTEPD